MRTAGKINTAANALHHAVQAKVTLYVNANVTYGIVDARKAVSQADDVRQTLYRET